MDLRETQFNPQHLPSRDKFAFCLLEHQNPLTFSSTALLLTPISPLSSHISYFFLSALKGFLFFLFSSWAFSLWHEVFSGGSAGKEFACNEEDLGSVPGLGRSPGGENDYPLQYSGMENSMDCIVHGVANSRTQLSDFHFFIVAWELSCPVAYGILIPPPGIEPTFSALEGEFLTTGPPGKSLSSFE